MDDVALMTTVTEWQPERDGNEETMARRFWATQCARAHAARAVCFSKLQVSLVQPWRPPERWQSDQGVTGAGLDTWAARRELKWG